jgi:hypothetical protein
MSYQEERLQEIADAIREVKGTTEKIPATNFASEISQLKVGAGGGYEVASQDNGDGTQTLIINSVDYIPSVLNDCTWEQINKACLNIANSGMDTSQMTSTYGWQIGDTKTFAMSDGEEVTIRLIDTNHDTQTNGNKAGVTFEMVGSFADKIQLYSGQYDNSGGWKESSARNTTMPSILEKLPIELKNVIKEVYKKSANGGGTLFTQVEQTADKLFLLSSIEVMGTGSLGATQNGTEEGTQYRYYYGKTASDRIKNINGSASSWALRSCGTNSSGQGIMTINVLGNLGETAVSGWTGCSVAFCI